MLHEDAHPSNQELLLVADGEIGSRRTASIRAHLASCWTCRTRMKEIEDTIAGLVHAYHDHLDRQLPPSAGPRALLMARLARAVAESGPASKWGLMQSFRREWTPAYVLAAMLFVAIGCTVLFRDLVLNRSENAAYNAEVGILPNRNFTPGIARHVTISDVCSMNHEEVVRDVPAELQKRVFEEYGLGGARAKDYEVDYLIAPGLGGADQVGNLWPEPYSTTWNAHVKDALEERLHELACEKKVDISTAQREIATDWISAYKKYFHTDKPIQNHSS